MAHPPARSASVSTSEASSSSIYDDHLDDPALLATPLAPAPDVPRRRRSLGLGPPTAPSPRDVARRHNHPLHYAFAQAFGERAADASPAVVVQEADMISAVQFNHHSDMVATGDKGGRIVILKRVFHGKNPNRRRASHVLVPSAAARNGRRRRAARNRTVRDDAVDGANSEDGYGADEDSHDVSTGYDDDYDDDDDDDHASRPMLEPPEFRFWTQFQSHEPEFDYLKSMEIEEKINQIRWCREASGSQRLIATNDKTIKLWRVCEREVKTVTTLDPASLLEPRSTSGIACNPRGAPRYPQSPQSPQSAAMGSRASSPSRPGSPRTLGAEAYHLRIPRLEMRGRVITATARKVFSNAHTYHINSISLNSDEETFLSADDLRVNLWNLDAGGTGFNVLDIKPDNMEDLTEVITSAEFHPRHCHLFMHSSSRGVVKLCDLRQSALCETWARKYEEPEDNSSRTSFFSEIIASISDVKFSPDGRYILTRDYMNLRLWDIHMERAPVAVVPVHEHLRSRLCDLYENDCIFDKFQCCFSSDGGSLLTGSYNSLFQSYSACDGVGTAVEASVDFVSGLSGRHHFSAEGLSANLIAGSSAAELVDPSRRIMHLDASPSEQIAAVAAGPALYLYYGLQQQGHN